MDAFKISFLDSSLCLFSLLFFTLSIVTKKKNTNGLFLLIYKFIRNLTNVMSKEMLVTNNLLNKVIRKSTIDH